MAAIVALLFLFPLPALAGPPLKINEPLPAFTLSALDGKQVSLPTGTNQPAVVVHFWAGWCSSCLRELPIIETLYQQYKSQGLVVYAVNVGQPQADVKGFAERLKLTYPVLLDPDSNVAGQLGVTGIPRTFFIDRSGLLRKKLLGEAPKRVLEEFIQTVLTREPGTAAQPRKP